MIHRSQTSMERGIKKVRKARTIVMVLLVAVAVAIILIDRKEQQGSSENYIIPQVNTAAASPFPTMNTEQIVENNNRPIVQQPTTVQSTRVPEIVSPVQDNTTAIVMAPKNEIILGNGSVKETGKDKLASVTPETKSIKKSEFSESKAETKSDGVHIVKHNETLSSIAKKYYGKSSLWKLIFHANQLKSENVATGQKLILPKVEANKTEMAKVEKTTKKSVEKFTAKSEVLTKSEEDLANVPGDYRKGKMYTIKKGENLSQIAKEAHVGFLELYEVNKKVLKDPHTLKPGLKIWIPDANMASLKK